MKILETLQPSKLAYGERLRPTRDWFVILAAVALLLIVSAAYSYFIFSQTKEAGNLEGGEVVQATATTTSSDVTGIFTDRERERDNYLHVYRFVDPSR